MADNAATLAGEPPAELTDELTDEAVVTGGDLAGDVLVEEVSIDGMCGVY